MTPPATDLARRARALARALEPWFVANCRDLSWRRTRDPYAIWVSEIMLQQTRVETVERYYADFVARFPDVGTLAAAEEASVLTAWSGLGYYRRARLLHKGARYVAEELGGHVPTDGPALRKIPGVGQYTAGAIASIAFDQPEPLVDGNVARVLSRIRALTDPKAQGADAKHHWIWTRAILEGGTPRLLAQALMELGATVCTPKRPRCEACPVRSHCDGFANDLTSEIPAPRKKVAQPVETLAALAIVVRNRLLMVRRPNEGLLASMWCLPLVMLAANVPDREGIAEWTDTKLANPEPATPVKHVFTHRIWNLTPLRYALPKRPTIKRGSVDDVVWIAPGERPEGGMPSVTEKLLARLDF